jgi:hypothetical protein
MNETLTVRRLYRDLFEGAALTLCGLLGLMIWRFLPAAGAPRGVFLSALLAGYALIGVAHFLFCWRHRLQASDGQIVSRGLLGETEIRLSDVTHVVWGYHGPGAVMLKTNFDKMTILFVRYSPEASVRIVQLVRQTVPASMQTNWDRFCLRVAIPLRNPAGDARRPEVVFARRQFDRLLGAFSIAQLAYAVAHWWLVGFRFPGDWATILFWLALTGVIWISVRQFIPKRYMFKPRWIPISPFIELIVDHLVCGICTLGLILLCFAFLFGIPRGLIIAEALLVIVALSDLARRDVKLWKSYQQEREHDLEHCEAAVREWELLDRSDPLGTR